jgi:Trypsin-like peptidase domain/ARMET, C-terminal
MTRQSTTPLYERTRIHDNDDEDNHATFSSARQSDSVMVSEDEGDEDTYGEQRVAIVGGIHQGKVGTFVRRTKKRIFVRLDHLPNCETRQFAPHNVKFVSSHNNNNNNNASNPNLTTPNDTSNDIVDNNSNPLSSLSVPELKHLLSNRGIDFRDCLEKRDLIERLEQRKSKPARSSAQHDPWGSSSPLHDRKGEQQESSRSSSKYTEEENNIIQTYKRVAPSVAGITTSNGTGSGFLWDQNGHIVTNCHVVMSNGNGYSNNIAKTVKVKLHGMAQSYDAIVIDVVRENDLAVLKIPAKNLPISSIIDAGRSDDLQVGQSVLAIGNPFGLNNTLTTGVVSALGRDILVKGFGGREIKGCVQTDGT